jgi:hypothetical protein
MSLLSTLTGGSSDTANQDLEQALAAIQGIQTPDAQEMQYQIQKLVQAGVITPEMAQTYLQSPNALASENVDQTGTQAQEESIADLLDAAKSGGENPAEQAAQAQLIQQMNTQERGANDAAIQGQAARGALTGGETLAAQLGNNQDETVNANETAEANAGNAYSQMLNELTSAGSLGSGLQGQENTQANTVAAATNAINQFNATQQQQEENMNVGAENTAQTENVENQQQIENQNTANQNAYEQYQAQLPQEVEQDALQKAQAEAGVNEAQANQATGQGEQNAGIWSGIVGSLMPETIFGGPNTQESGTGGTGGGSGSAGAGSSSASAGEGAAGSDALGSAGGTSGIVAANKGGLIHDYLKGGLVKSDMSSEKAKVPGNSPKNDKIPAMLSQDEVVLPRTITKNPQPDKVMDFLNRIRKPKTPHPDDVATVLHSLGRMRNGQ